MAKTFTRTQLSQTIFSSMQKSVPMYREMTGMDVIRAPEQFFAVAIAHAIHKELTRKKGFVVLELGTQKLMKAAKAIGLGRPLEIRHGKYDLAVFYDNNKPRAVIEVKTNVYKYDLARLDIERLALTVSTKLETNSLQLGVFIFFCSATLKSVKSDKAEESVQDRIQNIKENVEKQISKDKKFKNLKIHFSSKLLKPDPDRDRSIMIGMVELWPKPPRCWK